MSLSRRALFGMVAAAPLAAALGVPHDNDLTEASLANLLSTLPPRQLFRKLSSAVIYFSPDRYLRVTGFDAEGRRVTERICG